MSFADRPLPPLAPSAALPLRRRRVVSLGVACGALLGLPAVAQQRALPKMTEGPFYPSASWRARSTDWDADLTTVKNGGQSLVARGEHLGLDLRVLDEQGKAIDGVEFEIWQCDAGSIYRHPRVNQDEDRMDPGFQGFGSATTDSQGQVRFRTIQPVAYPGRTPHIHVKLRHASFRELTSQLFIAGHPGNARDGLWRRLGQQGQAAVEMVLQPAQDQGLRWRAQHTVVVAT